MRGKTKLIHHIQRIFIQVCCVCILFSSFGFSQLVPYYPVEIFFSPLGWSNEVPGGNKPTLYATMSSIKFAFYKELLTHPKWSTTLGIDGGGDFFQDITLNRSYNPLYANISTKQYCFLKDVVTVGTEVMGNIETIPGFTQELRIKTLLNYRVRLRPFMYLYLSPDCIVQQVATFGTSYFSDSSITELDPGRVGNSKNDYYIYKFETILIVLTNYFTRFFISPYCFYDRYTNLCAKSITGESNSRNPKLQEDGIGIAVGMSYSTLKRGIAEATFECEFNRDKIFDVNSYLRYKLFLRAENKFLTGFFGYSLMGSWNWYVSNRFKNDQFTLIGKPSQSNASAQLGQQEWSFSCAGIYNINKFISLQPEYQFLFRLLTQGKKYQRNQMRLHLDVSF